MTDDKILVGVYLNDELLRVEALDNPGIEFSETFNAKNEGTPMSAKPMPLMAYYRDSEFNMLGIYWEQMLDELFRIIHHQDSYLFSVQLDYDRSDLDPMSIEVDASEGCVIEQIRAGLEEAHDKVDRIRNRFELIVSELDMNEVRASERAIRLVASAGSYTTNESNEARKVHEATTEGTDS